MSVNANMKFYLSLFFLAVLSQLLNGQRTVILKTDSSVIKIHYSDYGRKWSNEFFNGKNLVREITYHDKDSSAISFVQYLDTTLSFKSRKGISKAYSEDGTPEWFFDNDSRILLYVDTLKYPNYNVLSKMKLKGDSILKSIYGNSFFEEHIKWNLHSSYYFDKTYYSEPSFTISWLRENTKNKYKATEFNIRYDIIYGNQKLEEAIQIIIDENGILLPSHGWNENWTIYNEGLEKPDSSFHEFILTGKEAEELAIKFGLQKQDKSKVWSHLSWESEKGSSGNIFNGHFTISVFQELTVTPPEKEAKYGTYVHHYEVWMFNPRTKEFLGKKTMHRDYSTGPGSVIVGPMIND